MIRNHPREIYTAFPFLGGSGWAYGKGGLIWLYHCLRQPGVDPITVTKTTIGTLFPALPQAIQDLNVGIIALFVNVVVMALVSLATARLAVGSKEKRQETTQA